jgi:hypothetical protein
VSTDPAGAHQDAHTDPMLPKITDDMPSPRSSPQVPVRAEPVTFGPDDDPSVLRQSAYGPVLRSRYGDFRPPVPVGRAAEAKSDRHPPEAPSLTGLGLTRRSWGRIGSRLFTLVFVAIFVLILIQAVVGLVTSASSP